MLKRMGRVVPSVFATLAIAFVLVFCIPMQVLASTSSVLADDLDTFATDAIEVKLFNYSTDINKKADGSWRDFIDYFSFRGAEGIDSSTVGGSDGDIPNPSRNDKYDEDGFTVNHATVLRTLDANGNPSLDPARKADGTYAETGIAPVSLAYLFDPNVADHAVTAYSPTNTMLVKSGTHYYYNSKENAVDYDEAANLLRLRGYVERNNTTAGACTPSDMFGDYLPFNHTGGVTIGQTESGIDYQIQSADVDYWFGTTIEVDFYQLADGQILGADGSTLEDMIFSFSGDDDVWVFVDGVLVLDLGGTHGTVNGTVNFATGEIQQYLTWNGKGVSDTDTSFPTTLRACFDAAGAVPNGGWNESGETFADFSKHTLKFFYLERGSAVANCKLDFNLPVLPEGDVTVTKLLSETEEGAYIPEDAEYHFVLFDGETHEPVSGVKYSVTKAHSIVEGLETDANGKFALKANETATFQLDSEKAYYVVELDSDYAIAEGCTTTTSGSVISESGDPNVSHTFMPDPDAEGGTEVIFTNTLKGYLEVSKQVAGEGADAAKAWPFEISLSGEAVEELLSLPCVIYDASGMATTPADYEIAFAWDEASGCYVGSVALRHGETAKVSGIPAYAEYSVVELDAAAEGEISEGGYLTSVEGDAAGTIKPGITSAVAFTNEFITPELIDFQVEAKKVLTGADLEAGAFSFTLEAADDASPMPEGAVEGVVTVANDEYGKVLFPQIQVTEDDARALAAGLVDEVVYSYLVGEVVLDKEGFTYDERVYSVEVRVVEGDNNQLEISEISYLLGGEVVEGAVFENAYKPPHSETEIPETGDGSPVGLLLISATAALLVALAAGRKVLAR